MATLTRQMKLTIAYADLAKVNATIDLLIANKLVQRLEIGSQEFRRVYDNNKISIADLMKLRNELLTWIDTLEPNTSIIYRNGASVPLITHRSF